jgi:3-deoxy-D-manno-octulosonic-acid transferase
MRFVLDGIYLLVLALASPWLLWMAIRKGKYREGFAAKFFGRVPQRHSDSPCLWLHAVSVGEVALLEPLIRLYSERHPRWQCVISTTTMTGYRVARERYPHHLVFYAPLDFSWAVREAMRRIRPQALVLAELELWPNLIAAARNSGAKVAIINGRLSERSFRGYHRVRWLTSHLLERVDLIAVQASEYAERFRRLGADPANVHVSGSLKFDGADGNRNHPAIDRLRELAGFDPADNVFLVGSTQSPEEELAVEAFLSASQAHSKLRLVIVPRHPERFDEVAGMLTSRGLVWQRRSLLDHHAPNRSARVLLVDRVGELRWWWGAAKFGFVGGSLGTRGGQNMIEPAAYGVATCFGPRTHNFREVVRLLAAHQAAVVVNDGAELTEFVRHCLDEPSFAVDLGRRAQQIVAAQQGATARTVELLERLLQSGHVTHSQAA